MTLRTGGLNGNLILRDEDLGALGLTLVNQGVISGMNVTLNTVNLGRALLLATRTSVTPNENFIVHVEITANETIDTSGTKKVWLALDSSIINDGSTAPNTNGTGIATIQTGASFPVSGMWIPLASITGGVITDARTFVTLKNITRTGMIAKGILSTDASGNEGMTIGSANQFMGFDASANPKALTSLEAQTILTGWGIFPSRTRPVTANGDILAGDCSYLTSADTVKTLYPSAMATAGSSVATSPTTTNTSNRTMPLSVAGKYLYIAGGVTVSAGPLKAQVRIINTAETDFTNGTEQTIYSTGAGVRGFDVCPIGTDKFLIIFQADTAGVGVGIKTVVISVDPSTGNITVGSIQGIESVGQLTGLCGCAMADTDKPCIFYQKDSDGDLYAQILSISGTTINTNSPLLVKVFGGTGFVSATQLSTNTMAIVYQDSSNNIFGRIITVSGTTPALGGTEQTILSSPGANPAGWGLKGISSTKICFAYSNNSPINDTIYNIAISGTTMTPSTGLALGSDRGTGYFGMEKAGKNYLLFYHRSAATTSVIRFLDISGTAPVSISTQNVSTSSITVLHSWSVVKFAPWTYLVTAMTADSDYIIKLTPVTTAVAGLHEANLANTVLGSIVARFNFATLSSLTAGTKYSIDDTGQLVAGASLTSATLPSFLAYTTTTGQLQ